MNTALASRKRTQNTLMTSDISAQPRSSRRRIRVSSSSANFRVVSRMTPQQRSEALRTGHLRLSGSDVLGDNFEQLVTDRSTVRGDNVIVVGSGNIIYGNGVTVYGSDNFVYGDNAMCYGESNHGLGANNMFFDATGTRPQRSVLEVPEPQLQQQQQPQARNDNSLAFIEEVTASVPPPPPSENIDERVEQEIMPKSGDLPTRSAWKVSVLDIEGESKQDPPPRLECVICLIACKDVLYIPCGHICCCRKCTRTLHEGSGGGRTQCPQCRSEIRYSRVIYL